MAIYWAGNHAYSTTTGIAAGTTYASGAKVAIQIATTSTRKARIVEWGISFNQSAAAVPATVELVQASAASTMSTAHSTSTIVPWNDPNAGACSFTMSTTACGYGNGSITSNTTEAYFDNQYISPMIQYVKQFPLGREPVVAVSKFLQLRINTAASTEAMAYILFQEC
jgi:hypothetical protein